MSAGTAYMILLGGYFALRVVAAVQSRRINRRAQEGRPPTS